VKGGASGTKGKGVDGRVFFCFAKKGKSGRGELYLFQRKSQARKCPPGKIRGLKKFFHPDRGRGDWGATSAPREGDVGEGRVHGVKWSGNPLKLFRSEKAAAFILIEGGQKTCRRVRL